MLAPFPQYAGAINAGTGTGGTTCYSCDEGGSIFHSLQVTLDRKVTSSLTTQLAYTFAKEIDDLSGTASQLGAVPGGTRNPYAPGLDRGLGIIDHRHNVHWINVYELPAGHGHRLGGNPIVDGALGNWEFTGIATYETGYPLGVTGSGCNVPGIVSTCMVSLNPSFSGNVVLSKVGTGNAHTAVYYNSAAFMDPAAFTFGNVPRAAPYGLTSPTNWEIDSSLRKSIPIHENLKASISADFFNLLNNVVFAPPATNIDSSTFGKVTTTQNSPRRIQLSGRITF